MSNSQVHGVDQDILFLNQTKGKHKSWACKRGGTRSDSDTSFSLALTPKMFYS